MLLKIPQGNCKIIFSKLNGPDFVIFAPVMMNMYKKRAALVFIFISNIILLVSAVIPHHHHHSLICFVASHCTNDPSESANSSTCNGHEHDGNSGSDFCLLKQDFLLPENQEKQDFRISDSDDSHFISFDFTVLILNNNQSAIAIHLPPLIGSPNESSSDYSCFVNSSLGLRAPPSV
jgi:hypothetical protein